MSIFLKSAVLALGFLAFVGTAANARLYNYRHFRHTYYGMVAPHYGMAYGAAPYYGTVASLSGGVGAGYNGGP